MTRLYKCMVEEAKDNKLSARKMMRLLCEFIEDYELANECLGYMSLACEETER